MKPKARLIAAFALLASVLGGCQKKETIFLDSWWNRDYAMNACELYKNKVFQVFLAERLVCYRHGACRSMLASTT